MSSLNSNASHSGRASVLSGRVWVTSYQEPDPLHPENAQKREAVSRLQHEAKVTGNLGHPNICEIYDMGRLEDGSDLLDLTAPLHALTELVRGGERHLQAPTVEGRRERSANGKLT